MKRIMIGLICLASLTALALADDAPPPDPHREAQQLLDEAIGEMDAQRAERAERAARHMRDGLQLYAQENFYEARKAFHRALLEDPTHQQAERYFGLSTARLEEAEDTRLEFDRHRDMARYERVREQTLLEMKLLRADELARKGHTQEAIDLYRGMRRDIERSYHANAFQDIADLIGTRIVWAMAVGEPDAGIDPASLRIDPVAVDEPKRIAAQRLLATARGYYHEGDLERAGAYAQAAVNLDPSSGAARALASALETNRQARAMRRLRPDAPPASRATVLRRREPEALRQPIRASFDGAPLKDALDYIETFADIDIVVDARQLASAGASLDSPVTLNTEGEPVSRVMQQLAGQVGMRAVFRNGVYELIAANATGEVAARRGNPDDGYDPDEDVLVIYDVAELLQPGPSPHDLRHAAMPPLPPMGIYEQIGFPGLILSSDELWQPAIPRLFGLDGIGFGGHFRFRGHFLGTGFGFGLPGFFDGGFFPGGFHYGGYPGYGQHPFGFAGDTPLFPSGPIWPYTHAPIVRPLYGEPYRERPIFELDQVPRRPADTLHPYADPYTVGMPVEDLLRMIRQVIDENND